MCAASTPRAVFTHARHPRARHNELRDGVDRRTRARETVAAALAAKARADNATRQPKRRRAARVHAARGAARRPSSSRVVVAAVCCCRRCRDDGNRTTTYECKSACSSSPRPHIVPFADQRSCHANFVSINGHMLMRASALNIVVNHQSASRHTSGHVRRPLTSKGRVVLSKSSDHKPRRCCHICRHTAACTSALDEQRVDQVHP